MSGRFIVFEGPDGAGTTRQSAFLAERLRARGEKVVLTTEPSDSGVGKDIRKMLHADRLPSPEAIQLLFCADRADHVANIIKPALEQGATVICDRYALSTIIYGSAQGVDQEWLEAINAVFPQPDFTVITLPPFEVCMERLSRRKKKDRFEVEQFQRRVYELYRSVEDPDVVFIDTSGEKEDTADMIEAEIDKRFGVTLT